DQKLSKSIDNLNNALEQASKVFNEDNQKAFSALIQNASKMFGDQNQKAVNDVLVNLNKVLCDENIKNVNATLKNVRDASGRLEQFAKSGTEAAENIRKVTQPLTER